MDRFRLDGRVALVSGTASGIGRATALALAEAGANVVGVDINGEAGQATAAEIGSGASFVEGDVSDPRQRRTIFEFLDGLKLTATILINVAGRPGHAPALRVGEDQWTEVLETNVKGTFHMAQLAAERMIAAGRPGAIVNISSVSASTSLGRGHAAYGASKAAILQMTRELAVEWAVHGIRVNAIQPCQVRTPAFQRVLDNPRFDGPALMVTVLRGIPLGRIAEATDIAAAAVFLASDAAAMITGVALPVDGGNLAFNASGTVPNA